MSVGHVARALEESGIPTVTVMVKAFEHRAREMTLPRTVIVRHPMGRPLGAAFDRVRQSEVVLASFQLIETASESGTIVELPHTYRPNPSLP
ncbi:MAG: hypothetical protein QGD89_09695 [Actinomycetota bacterium]|nr:hypothetical protein [Actinomycetota bacterium]